YAGASRMHSDGWFGTNGIVQYAFGNYYSASSTSSAYVNESDVLVNVFENPNSLNNLNAQFQLANPGNADQFYLGGEDIPLGVALGASTAPFTLIDDHHTSGTFGFAASSYT